MTDSAVNQTDKEILILNSPNKTEAIAGMYKISSRTAPVWLRRAVGAFLPFLKRAFEEAFEKPAETKQLRILTGKMGALLSPREVGHVMADSRFDRLRWSRMRVLFKAAIPSPPDHYSLTGLTSASPSVSRTISRRGRFHRTADLGTLTQNELDILSEGREFFWLVGKIQGDRLTGFRSCGSRHVQPNFHHYFQISIQSVVTANGEQSHIATQACGTGAPHALELLRESGKIEVAEALLKKVKIIGERRERKNHRFKRVKDLATIKRFEVDMLSGGRKHFVLVCIWLKPDKLGALDAVSLEDARRMDARRIKIETLRLDRKGGFRVLSASGKRVMAALDPLVASGMFSIP
ncbi:MAG: hypothetical protein U1D33_00325, partial [bacterium]|nr:hypothetical protein [bacterium]